MEESDDSSAELPSFETLVERLVDGEPRSDEPGVPDEVDESRWEWGATAAESVDGSEDRTEDHPREPDERTRRSAETAALIELIADVSNVLVVGPTDSTREHHLCAGLCTAGSSSQQLLLVTTSRPPQDRVNALQGFGLTAPDETTVIAVGEPTRSVPNDRRTGDASLDEGLTAEAVRNPRDLSRLGLLVNNHLGDAQEGAPPVLCVHTLSSLLEVMDVERVFRFLHILSGRVRNAGGTAHYHLDPDDVSAEALETLKPIFDLTVQFSRDGDVSVDR